MIMGLWQRGLGPTAVILAWAAVGSMRPARVWACPCNQWGPMQFFWHSGAEYCGLGRLAQQPSSVSGARRLRRLDSPATGQPCPPRQRRSGQPHARAQLPRPRAVVCARTRAKLAARRHIDARPFQTRRARSRCVAMRLHNPLRAHNPPVISE